LDPRPIVGLVVACYSFDRGVCTLRELVAGEVNPVLRVLQSNGA
jgi:hypothetical protein